MTGDIHFAIRKLSPAGSERGRDIAAIKKLCSDRSYMGKDISEVFSYKELWANLVIDPYLEISPDLIWVAVDRDNDEVIGYLTGAVRDDFYELQDEFVTHYIDKLSTDGLLHLFSNPVHFWGNALSVLAGLDHRTIEFLKYLKTKARNDIPKHPSTPHFNVFARYDEKGIARALIESYMAELKREGITRYHITALYVPGERMWHELTNEGFRVRSLGFFQKQYSVYDAVPTSIFAPYALMIGCFETDVPSSPIAADAGGKAEDRNHGRKTGG